MQRIRPRKYAPALRLSGKRNVIRTRFRAQSLPGPWAVVTLRLPLYRLILLVQYCLDQLIWCLPQQEDPLRYLDRLQPLALLLMRLTLGAVMVGHGYHNVFGGLHHHVLLVQSLGLPAWLGYVSAFAEFVGGILVLIGLFTRAAAFAICIDMCVAIAKVHFPHGLMGQGGYEFPLSLATLAFALVCFGGGPIAFDHIRAPGSVAKSK